MAENATESAQRLPRKFQNTTGASLTAILTATALGVETSSSRPAAPSSSSTSPRTCPEGPKAVARRPGRGNFLAETKDPLEEGLGRPSSSCSTGTGTRVLDCGGARKMLP